MQDSWLMEEKEDQRKKITRGMECKMERAESKRPLKGHTKKENQWNLGLLEFATNLVLKQTV